MVAGSHCESTVSDHRGAGEETRGRLLDACQDDGPAHKTSPAGKDAQTGPSAGLSAPNPEGGFGNVLSPIASGVGEELKTNGVKLAVESAIGVAVGVGVTAGATALGIGAAPLAAIAGVGALGYGAYKWFTGDLGSAISGMGRFFGAVADAYNPRGLSAAEQQEARNTLFDGGRTVLDYAPDAVFLGAGAAGFARALSKRAIAGAVDVAAVDASTTVTPGTVPSTTAMKQALTTTTGSAGEFGGTDAQAAANQALSRPIADRPLTGAAAGDNVPAGGDNLTGAAIDAASQKPVSNLPLELPPAEARTALAQQLRETLEAQMNAGQTLSESDQRWMDLEAIDAKRPLPRPEGVPRYQLERDAVELDSFRKAAGMIPDPANAEMRGYLAGEMSDQGIGTSQRFKLASWLRFPDNPQLQESLRQEFHRNNVKDTGLYRGELRVAPAKPGEVADLWKAIDANPQPNTGVRSLDMFNKQFELWSRARAQNLESYVQPEIREANGIGKQLKESLQARTAAGEKISDGDARWFELDSKPKGTLTEAETNELGWHRTAAEYFPGDDASRARELLVKEGTKQASVEERAELQAWMMFPNNPQFQAVARRELVNYNQQLELIMKGPTNRTDSAEVAKWSEAVDSLNKEPVLESQREELLDLLRYYPALSRPSISAMQPDPIVNDWKGLEDVLRSRLSQYCKHWTDWSKALYPPSWQRESSSFEAALAHP